MGWQDRGSGGRWRGGGTRWKTTYAVLDVNVSPTILHLLVLHKEILDVHVGKLVEFSVGDFGGLSALKVIGGRGLGEVLTCRERALESWSSIEAVGL